MTRASGSSSAPCWCAVKLPTGDVFSVACPNTATAEDMLCDDCRKECTQSEFMTTCEPSGMASAPSTNREEQQ